MKEGNQRFVGGYPQRPHQTAARRSELEAGQSPQTVLFGCSDSRVAAEILFDQGLGDMFVVRTAGQVIDSAVLGSIEYAVNVLGTPLIAILGHDSCGAVAATISSLDNGEVPGGYIRDVVVRVMPSILQGRKKGLSTPDELGGWHVEETGIKLLQRSQIIAEAVRDKKAAIVYLTYQLADGRAVLRGHVGDIGEP